MSPPIRPSVAIIGAGLSGLTLGQCLKRQGIATTIYESAMSPPPRNYAITLHPSTYRPLLPILAMTEAAFRHSVAVDRHRGGTGIIDPDQASAKYGSFRCNRQRLERLLAKDLDIRYNMKLQKIVPSPEPDKNALPSEGSRSTTIEFRDVRKESRKAALVVGCDGVHSKIRRRMAWEAKTPVKVLPYVVFEGRRTFSIDEYMARIYPLMMDALILSRRIDNILLQISVRNVDTRQGYVQLSYVYSRPAAGGGSTDKMFDPKRPRADASKIPDELYVELEELKEVLKRRDLDRAGELFLEMFDPEKVRADKKLNWLMRYVEPNAKQIAEMAKSGVVLIGDAAHGTPILGGEGANEAITDGFDLADWIKGHWTQDLDEWTHMKQASWAWAVEDSKRKIEWMHGGKTEEVAAELFDPGSSTEPWNEEEVKAMLSGPYPPAKASTAGQVATRNTHRTARMRRMRKARGSRL